MSKAQKVKDIDPTLEEIAHNIREVCEPYWGYEQLAAAARVPAATVRRLWLGETWPRGATPLLSIMATIIATFGVKIDDLLPENWIERYSRRGLVLLRGKVDDLADGQVKKLSRKSGRSSRSKKSGGNSEITRIWPVTSINAELEAA